MHNTSLSIETLREEAQRELQQLKNLLEKAQGKGFVDKPAAPGESPATFDTASLPKTLAILDGESKKLDKLDLVLAVVGTMKAGKSTSINAIVGAEVLPNRNRPMTTLPTLIRHTPGVLQPRLIFENVDPLNELLANLRATLQRSSKKTLENLQNDQDVADLVQKIQQGEIFKSIYKDKSAIYHFLKELNDLTRLCSDLEKEFPFDKYTAVDSMPVIEMEFSHLKDTQVNQGRLILLDTPGPNEAGQKHLREMLKDQLQKASAVLVVLDYTQLKSDADEEIREYLRGIANTAKNRMYVLVNKFDQKDRHGDSEERVKAHVANTLMKGIITQEHVYAVSAQRGYLASRARNEIQAHGKLPGKEPWVNDFGELALGMNWSTEKAQDTALIKKCADTLWEKSGFALPLEQVIRYSYHNAALDALRSAAVKLGDNVEKINDLFKSRAGAFKIGVNKLKEKISTLQKNIKKLIKIKENLEKSLDDLQKDVSTAIKYQQNEIKAKIKDSLNEYFSEGMSIANEKNSKAKERQGLNRDFDPSQKIFTFHEKNEAEKFINRIKCSINTVMTDAEGEFNDSLELSIAEFYNEFKKYRKQSIGEIKSSIDKEVEGLDISIRPPEMKPISFDATSSIFEDGITEKTRSGRYRKSGLWGWLCEKFNTDDLGWESYSEQIFNIDLEKIKKSSTAITGEFYSKIKDNFENNIIPCLKKSMENFFSKFTDKIENICGDLQAGIRDHEMEEREQATRLKDAEEMVHEVSSLAKDGAALNGSIENLCSTADFLNAQTVVQ